MRKEALEVLTGRGEMTRGGGKTWYLRRTAAMRDKKKMLAAYAGGWTEVCENVRRIRSAAVERRFSAQSVRKRRRGGKYAL